MFIGGSEWIIILLLALFLLFGTKKLPQLSRTIGKAAGEYKKAQELLRTEIEEATRGSENNEMHMMDTKVDGPVSSEHEKLETIARSLKIEYIGKTDDEIRALISKKIHGYN
jgi:sec-independent protein translocase protein TatA